MEVLASIEAAIASVSWLLLLVLLFFYLLNFMQNIQGLEGNHKLMIYALNFMQMVRNSKKASRCASHEQSLRLCLVYMSYMGVNFGDNLWQSWWKNNMRDCSCEAQRDTLLEFPEFRTICKMGTTENDYEVIIKIILWIYCVYFNRLMGLMH